MAPLPRRARVAIAAVVTGAAVLTCTAADPGAGQPPVKTSLFSDGVALGPDGPVLIPAGEGIARLGGGEGLRGTSIGLGAESASEVAASIERQQMAWLSSGTVPGPPEYAGMAEQALLDLDTLVLPNGAAVAAWSTRWRYVWPRDASFVVVALARTGHPDDALRILRFLARVQAGDGTFEARYLPDGSGAVPDDRGIQLDGSGWFTWAVAEWFDAATPGARRDAAVLELVPAVDRALDAIGAHLEPGTDLPEAGPDYWEVSESEVTLGTAAPLLLGARSADRLRTAVVGSGGELPPGTSLERSVELANRLDAAIERSFGATGYPRHIGAGDPDAAIAFLMPPFAPARQAVIEASDRAALAMRRPAGGLAPGAGWKQDGISWTPETALFALTAAASGDEEGAVGWLDWLNEHRTGLGSLPEKVTADGEPAAVAPLAWTAALALLTLDELDRVDGGI